MKQEIDKLVMVSDLLSDARSNWSTEGAFAIVEYILRVEREENLDGLWDVNVVRLNFFEGCSAWSAAALCGLRPNKFLTEQQALDLLKYEGIVIIKTFPCGRMVVGREWAVQALAGGAPK